MNSRIKAYLKEKYPEAVIEYEFNGEVQFWENQYRADNGDDTYLRCAIIRDGKVEVLTDW